MHDIDRIRLESETGMFEAGHLKQNSSNLLSRNTHLRRDR